MLYDCPECGEAYAANEGVVTLCPNCDAENVASFEKPLGAPKSARKGAWAAGLGAAVFVLVVAAISWSTLDIDGDGLSTYREAQEGSDPFDGDTDGDGIADGWEYRNGFDMLSADSDGDGIDDLADIRGSLDNGGTLCGALPISVRECTDGQDGKPTTEPDAPPAEQAAGTTWVFGAVSTLVAGVAGRIVSTAILRR